MRLDEIVAWYQKKIGTYDKQIWEKTIEQKILNGFTHLPLKNTKLKTELIDVDLVRGSTFPKAKSKLSILTVMRLAVLRLLFLPVYAKWWVRQTSPRVFMLLLSLYLMQMLNLGIYSYNINSTHSETEHIVSISEFLIPMALSLLLSVILSQIVATASNNNSCHKMKKCHSHSNVKKRERVRRRRRPRVDIKPTAVSDEATLTNDRTKTFLKNVNKINTNQNNNDSDIEDKNENCDSSNTNISKATTENKILNKIVNSNSKLSNSSAKDESKATEVIPTKPINLTTNCSATPDLGSTSSVRKRNVNWDLSIKSDIHDSTSAIEPDLVPEPPALVQVIDDDGFESLNSKSSGGEDNSNHGNKEDGSTTPALYYKKLPYTNNRIKEIQENEKSDSDTDTLKNMSPSFKASKKILQPDPDPVLKDKKLIESTDTDEENDDIDLHVEPKPAEQVTVTATERNFLTTNSEDCSYSSEINHSDTQNEQSDDEFELEEAPAIILNPTCGANDRVSCTIWEAREAKKAEMSVLDISSAIIERVEAMPETCDYAYIGVVLSLILSLIPAFCRLCEATVDASNSTEVNFLDMPTILLEKASFSCITILRFAFGDTTWEKTVLIVGFIMRLCLTYLIFFLLSVAERTFKQRFLYAKLFSHITSSRRAQKSGIPHFRLNKVRNIKTWLCVRSYLKRRGPQNSVDVIVSAAFIITLLLLAFLSVEWLKDSVHLHSQFNLEALVWSCSFGTFLLRFMTLGTKINKKYKSVSVLITEQINLYVQIEQKPNKKEELMVSNNVLKLAADLLKELESPFKVSGLSANPYLYTTVKVVILSALSGVLSEMLGFKLKLHKIKIK